MAKTATILTKTDGAISFAVDAVDPCQDRVPTELWGKTLTESTDGRAFASSHVESCPMVPIPGHALATAVHLAFSQHWPLCLSPDVIWITIAQGLAHHIENHTETLRPIFVGHPGKMCLSADQGATIHWPTVVTQWCDGIEEQVGPEIADLFVCNFTTTTSITKTVSQVVMMDTFQEYFEYVLRSICGIPTVTLEGTAADWRDILRRVRLFHAFDCPWWTERLLPICEGLVATAEGEPSLTFWQSLYKPQAVYGGDVITGWVGDLFPYVKDPVTAAPTVRNPLLAPRRVDLQVKDGIQIKDLPNGLSCTRIRQQLADGTIQSDEIVAGLIGLSQQPVTGSVCAELGWWVASEPLMTRLIASLPDSPQPRDTKSLLNIFMGTMTRELVELIARRGGTTLFGETSHPWKLYTFGECGECTQHPNRAAR